MSLFHNSAFCDYQVT